MLCLTCTMIACVDLAHYEVFHAKDWIPVYLWYKYTGKMEISAEKTRLMTNCANGILREIKVKGRIWVPSRIAQALQLLQS